MTTTFNRSELLNYFELSPEQQKEANDYFDSLEDCINNTYVIHKGKKYDSLLPLCMFMRTQNNKFTHGIYSTSHFDGFFITFNYSCNEVVIAHKYF
jgi:hypothetical protein